MRVHGPVAKWSTGPFLWFPEYALVLALVVVVLIGTLSTLGTTLQGKLSEIIQQVAEAGQ